MQDRWIPNCPRCVGGQIVCTYKGSLATPYSPAEEPEFRCNTCGWEGNSLSTGEWISPITDDPYRGHSLT